MRLGCRTRLTGGRELARIKPDAGLGYLKIGDEYWQRRPKPMDASGHAAPALGTLMYQPPPPQPSAQRRSYRSLFAFRGRGRLLRHTFLIAMLLVSSGLLTSGVIELICRYRESMVSIQTLQQEMAQSAAFKIQQYVENLARFTFQLTVSMNPLVVVGWRYKPESS
jgi:hypothetical protein